MEKEAVIPRVRNDVPVDASYNCMCTYIVSVFQCAPQFLFPAHRNQSLLNVKLFAGGMFGSFLYCGGGEVDGRCGHYDRLLSTAQTHIESRETCSLVARLYSTRRILQRARGVSNLIVAR